MQNKKDLSRSKEIFHRNMAKLPFEKKVAIVKKLRKIARNIRSSE